MKSTYCSALRLLLFISVALPSLSFPQDVAAADDPIILRYDFAAPQVAQIGEYHSVTIEGLPNLEQAGMPRLPIQTARILVPFERRVSGIEVICDTRVEMEGTYLVEPGQAPVPLSRTGPVSPTLPSPEVYSSSGPFPAALHSAASSQMSRGYQILVLTLYPMQYTPQQGRLSYCASLTVRVDTEAVSSRQDGMLRHRPRQWAADREAIQAIVDNPDAVESYPSSAELSTRARNVADAAPLLNPGAPYDYVIITNEALMGAPGPNNFQALVTAKEARGISAVVTTTEWISATYSGARPDGGEDLQTKIRNFIDDAYQTWGTEYILLGGDGDGADVGGESGDAIIPHRGFASVSGEIDYDIPADMYYACLDGTFDYDADGIYAEPTDGPGGGEVDLYAEVYVGRAAVDSADELANFVAKTLAYESENDAYLRDAWMVGEDLGWTAPWGGDRKDDILNSSSAAGYATVGFEGSPYAAFFNTQTLYDRDYPGNDWPTSEIIDVINSPTHIINHLGHANVTYVMKMYNSDVDSSLTNDHYFIGYSQGCYDGAFDNRSTTAGSYYSSDSISEHLTGGAHGAVAFVSNSRYGWGHGLDPHLGASQYYDRQFWDAILGENIFNVGRANQDSKEDTYGVVGPGGFSWVMRWVYYELNVFGDPELVIKTCADIVVYQNHTIDDDNSGGSSGNDNGRVDVGETIEMDVALFNTRQTEVTTVTAMLSTTDTYITISDDLASYGDIAPAGTATSITPYVFSVDIACPDDHWITFTLDITGTIDITGTVETWSDTFLVEVHSEPQIEVSPTSYDETLDWGESVTRTLTITNNGPASLEFEICEISSSGAGCSETYGSWSSTYSGSTRDRGDIFHVITPTTLSEIRMYLNFAASTDMYFFVYESDTLDGFYTKIHETFIASTGSGEGWYSSGTVNVSLEAGKYYYVGASWNGSATYGRSTESVPMPATCLGTLETGVPGSLAGYPPGNSFTNSYSGYSPYYMYLEFRGADVPWLSEAPITGTVPAYSAVPITITFDAAQVDEPGVYQADLRVSSNDPYSPTVSIPVTMTVQPDPNMGKLVGGQTGGHGDERPSRRPAGRRSGGSHLRHHQRRLRHDRLLRLLRSLVAVGRRLHRHHLGRRLLHRHTERDHHRSADDDPQRDAHHQRAADRTRPRLFRRDPRLGREGHAHADHQQRRHPSPRLRHLRDTGRLQSAVGCFARRRRLRLAAGRRSHRARGAFHCGRTGAGRPRRRSHHQRDSGGRDDVPPVAPALQRRDHRGWQAGAAHLRALSRPPAGCAGRGRGAGQLLRDRPRCAGLPGAGTATGWPDDGARAALRH